MRIWDVHVHFTYMDAPTPVARMADLLRYADRMGIERLCVYMGMEFDYDPTPEVLRRQNDEVLEVLARWPDRLFGFVYLNPKYPEASMEELERCVARGPMVGVKLWTAVRAASPLLDPLIARAAALNAVIFQHTYLKVGGEPAHPGGANLPGESTPADVAALAARHPTARLILGHSGSDWELGIRAIRAFPNVAVETAGFDPTAGMVEMAVRELGAERVVYGSDAGGRSYASQLAKVYGAAIPERQKALILSGNLIRMMQPILRQKGIRIDE